MKILATRIHSQDDELNTIKYKIEKGGGIVPKGGNITATYREGSDPATGLALRNNIMQTSVKQKLRSVIPGIGFGVHSRSTLPILSEGIGIPYVGEVLLGGKIKFEGSFNEEAISFKSKGITNPSMGTRVKEFNYFLKKILEKNKELESILPDDSVIGCSYNIKFADFSSSSSDMDGVGRNLANSDSES